MEVSERGTDSDWLFGLYLRAAIQIHLRYQNQVKDVGSVESVF